MRTITDAGPRRPAGAGRARACRWRSASLAVVVVLVGVPLGQLPFSEQIDNGHTPGPGSRRGRCDAEPRQLHPVVGQVELHRLRGQGRLPRVLRRGTAHGRGRASSEGCGRAFWEYEKELDRYGTPMALMLLPHWTDGCIGSMEGLYFEASATTPFHFLTQVELSTAPSAAQRDLPYGRFDITKGVDHLQMMGVRYYMATSANAVAPGPRRTPTSPRWPRRARGSSSRWPTARWSPRWTTSPRWSRASTTARSSGWRSPSTSRAGSTARPSAGSTTPTQWDVPLARSGPDEWQRVAVGRARPRRVPLDAGRGVEHRRGRREHLVRRRPGGRARCW